MSKTNKIKVYKNRYGKEPIVVGEMRMSEFNRPIGFTHQNVEDLKFNTVKPSHVTYLKQQTDSGVHPPMIPTKGSEYTGEIWCPYIPMMSTEVIKSSVWRRFQIKFELWFHGICHREYRSKYLMECLQDLYENFGKEYLLTLNGYTTKTVNPDYYSKIVMRDDAED